MRAADLLLSGRMKSIENLDVAGLRIGRPEEMERAALEAARAFEGASTAIGSRETAYTAALRFLRGELRDEDSREYDLLAGALAVPIREQEGRMVLAAGRGLDGLLARYRAEQRRAEVLREVDEHEHSSTCMGSCEDIVPFTDEGQQ